jgi:hypothetical protein
LRLHIIKTNAFSFEVCEEFPRIYSSEIYILKLNSLEFIQISRDIKLLITWYFGGLSKSRRNGRWELAALFILKWGSKILIQWKVSAV